MDHSIVEPLSFDGLSRDTVCATVIAPESNLTLQAENPLVLRLRHVLVRIGMPSPLDLLN